MSETVSLQKNNIPAGIALMLGATMVFATQDGISRHRNGMVHQILREGVNLEPVFLDLLFAIGKEFIYMARGDPDALDRRRFE